MGTKDGVTEGRPTVEVDDRGRVTIPKPVRERLGILPGDELTLEFTGDGLRLVPDRSGLVVATSGKTDWGPETFPDSGEATFGGRASGDR